MRHALRKKGGVVCLPSLREQTRGGGNIFFFFSLGTGEGMCGEGDCSGGCYTGVKL